MNQELLLKINALIAKAKAEGKPDMKFKVASGNTSSLAKVITTQEQADTFMKILRAL